MKKYYIYLPLFFFLGVSFNAQAQITYSHSLGVFYAGATHQNASGLIYSPRVNFLELTDESTLSLGSHLALGTTSDNIAYAYAMVDVPLVVEYNFGQHSSPYADAMFGGFVGAGYDYVHFQHINYEAYNNPGNIHGPMLNGGVRAIVLEMPLTLRAAYTYNLSQATEFVSNVFSLSLHFNLN